MPGNELVQSLARGLDALRILAESESPLSISELCMHTGLKRSTLHNILRTLISRGFALKENGRYSIGGALYNLVNADALSARLQRAEEAVTWLAKELPSAIISYCEPVGSEILVRFRQFPDRLLMERNSGAVMLPYQTASGLGCLAFADPETVQQIQMRHPFHLSGQQTWKTEACLRNYLGEIRETGAVRPPFCNGSHLQLAGIPAYSATDGFLGVFGAAWRSDSTDTSESDTVVCALQKAADRMNPPGSNPLQHSLEHASEEAKEFSTS